MLVINHMKYDWYQHRTQCQIYNANTPLYYCGRCNKLREKFYKQGKYLQQESISIGRKEILGFVETIE